MNDTPVRRRQTTLRCGFIPLIDCAVPVVAKEMGFAAQENIDLQLVRETSWANIRDRVTVGHIEGAHMLAGMAIAANLGLGNVRSALAAPFSLGLNGNAITVSTSLYERMAATLDLTGAEGPMEMAQALAEVIAARKAAGDEPLTFGMVYPFSCHNYELRYWLAAAGIHPDQDVRIVVIPPPLIVEYLEGGFVDGFCVGEPWNSLAATAGAGRLIVANADLWRMGPEKVLGLRTDWIEREPEAVAALIRAMDRAARWADDPANRTELAALLSQPDYVGVDAKLVENILAGVLQRSPTEPPTETPNLVLFHRNAANFPWKSHALWIYSQMVRWGQVPDTPRNREIAAATYRPDLYRHALRDFQIAMPARNSKLEGSLREATPVGSESGTLYLGPDEFFDGRRFDPDRLDDYLASFDISRPFDPDAMAHFA